MPKKNIIVIGYPKSGTTWLSRLVAELVQCPLQGDWGFDHIQALYKEGEERDSDFKCYKSHHTYQELSNVSKDTIHKIIYIVRDPRDIVISGLHYFNFYSKKKIFLKKLSLSWLTKLFSNVLEKKQKKKMINAVLNGDQSINKWLRLSWRDHLNNYKGKEVLFVKYENLLDHPQETCTAILTYLEVEKNSAHVLNSIENQSFEKRKKEMISTDNPLLKKIIRKGTHGYWKDAFTEKEKMVFNKYIKDIAYYD